MKELINHIESLLLENDCVILPNFGGFITHHSPARWIEDEKTFLPPYRSVGFNAQLKINDGLLVQSYMQTHDATYPEATRLVEIAIERFAETLYKEGFLEMHGIGTLRRTISGEYSFEPTEDGVITPDLYGLGALTISPLCELKKAEKEPIRIVLPITTPQNSVLTEKEPVEENVSTNIFEEEIHETEETISTKTDKAESGTISSGDKTWTIRIKHQWIANIISVAAAVLLFFSLSTPVGNTEIEEENFASLGSIDLLKQLNGRSMVTTLLPSSTTEAKPVSQPTEVKKTLASDKTSRLKKSESTKPAETKTVESVPAIKEQPAVTTTSTVQKTENVQSTLQPIEKQENKVATKPVKTKYYHVIVASVPSQADADKAVSNYTAQGYTQATCISGSGRFRISIAAFDTEIKAYQKINEFKEQGTFKDAWVLTRRQ